MKITLLKMTAKPAQFEGQKDRVRRDILFLFLAALSLVPTELQVRADSGILEPIAAKSISPASQFQAGDRWSAIGDSITHTGFYTDYIYLFYATRFPDRPIDFFNCGSAGDTAKGTFARLQKDILRHKPTVATIMLGMNDVRRGLYSSKNTAPDLLAQRDAAMKIHFENMKALAEKLQAAGVKLIFITPSIFDDTAEISGEKSIGVNAALGRSAENTKHLANEFKASLVDFHGPMTALNLEQQKLNPKFTLIGPDRVHPKEMGGGVMAYLFLKAQGVPQFVEDIAIDAAGKSEVLFTNKANALPFPVPAECAEALKLVPFTEDLNQERLRVTHLLSGKYKLMIDDDPMGSFTAVELQHGVNLAAITNTPEYRQALVVAKLNRQRYELVQILRTLDFLDAGINPNYGVTDDFDYAAVLAKRKSSNIGWGQRLWVEYEKYKPQQAEVRKQVEILVADMRKTSQPQPHRFNLKKE
ncbi:MAG: SGNH/GDSL hydrolase family protein [Kiritimatiellaeota bacterium]|nr:SGNH/GDSL hydrolase family protein [Kiritimatiellota bacterium]